MLTIDLYFATNIIEISSCEFNNYSLVLPELLNTMSVLHASWEPEMGLRLRCGVEGTI